MQLRIVTSDLVLFHFSYDSGLIYFQHTGHLAGRAMFAERPFQQQRLQLFDSLLVGDDPVQHDCFRTIDHRLDFPLHRFRQMADVDIRFVDQYDQPFDQVFHLTHVAGPVVIDQPLDGSR